MGHVAKLLPGRQVKMVRALKAVEEEEEEEEKEYNFFETIVPMDRCYDVGLFTSNGAGECSFREQMLTQFGEFL